MSGTPVVAAAPVGVLVMAHGTPASPACIEAFYTRIRRGRPPSAEQLAELVGRYEAIGGISPLSERTADQVAGIAAALEEGAGASQFLVRFGAKHVEPFIEDAARELATAGVARVVGIVLTPHRASMGSDEYLDRAEAALGPTPERPALLRVPQWYDAPGFAELMAERVRAGLGALAGHERGRRIARRTTVLFTAHSLPERVIAAGDPYAGQVAASAAAVASSSGLDAAGIAWQVAWQSAGRTDEPWIGPDLLTVLRRLGAEADGRDGAVLVCPIGFVSDHLEVLYDDDIEARAVAAEAGLAFARTESLNADARFCAILADVVRAAAAPPGPP